MFKYYVSLFVFLFSSLAAGSCQVPCQAGYNAPYRIKSCLDVFTRVQFLYYQALEEGLDLGSDQTVDGNTTTVRIKGMDFFLVPALKLDWANTLTMMTGNFMPSTQGFIRRQIPTLQEQASLLTGHFKMRPIHQQMQPGVSS